MKNTSSPFGSRRLATRIGAGLALASLPLAATIAYAASEQDSEDDAQTATIVEERIFVIDPDSEEGEGGSNRSVFVIRDGEEVKVHTETSNAHHVIVRRTEGKLSEEEIEEIMIEVRQGLSEAEKTLENLPLIIEESVNAAQGHEGHTTVEVRCEGGDEDVSRTVEHEDGTRVVTICTTRVMAQAVEGLKSAREALLHNSELSEETREKVVEELEQQIRRLESKEG